jgi:hypothetical protein
VDTPFQNAFNKVKLPEIKHMANPSEVPGESGATERYDEYDKEFKALEKKAEYLTDLVRRKFHLKTRN